MTLENSIAVHNRQVEEPSRVVLYKNYTNEIFSIIGCNKRFTLEDSKNEIELINKNKDVQWNDIWHNGELSGFVIVGKGSACHPNADYFIIQTYIVPKFRRQGIGKQFMLEYIKNHPGVYCLDIIDRNDIAHKFWSNVFSESNYSRIVIPYIEHGEGIGTHMYAWDKGR